MSNKVFQIANTIVYKPCVPLRKKVVCRWICKSVPGMVHVLLVSFGPAPKTLLSCMIRVARLRSIGSKQRGIRV